VGIIAPVNESVWEHLKLVLWPALIFSIVEYYFVKNKVNNFWAAKTASILLAIILIVIIFYSYTYFTGKNILAADISLFVIAVILGQLLSFRILTSPELSGNIQILAAAIIFALIIIFSVFTFLPPQLPIFKNPIDGTYGI
jgi:peptidoglycan/LPS O-acetylase OafA/YrhL